LLNTIDRLFHRIPFVQSVYSAVKKLVGAMQSRPDGQRVVLIEFPHPGMKAVGLVTCTFDDAQTGVKLAAVYVPTTPNPTSGYIEIVPFDQMTHTDWSVDDAMKFIMSGGVVAPEKLDYYGLSPKPDAVVAGHD
jgi:uncharacterized membrane protein